MTANSAQLRDLAWSQVQSLVERQLGPLGDLAMRQLELEPGDSVLDIGCGAGSTLRQLADQVGPLGQVLGVDISQVMVDRALADSVELAQVRVVLDDAATRQFDQGQFRVAYSRFGVMFFDDPIAAFANIHRSLQPGGCLSFVCWRSLQENELDLAPLKAAAACLPDFLVEAAGRARPFSLGSRDIIKATLVAAGFVDVRIEACDMPVTSGDLDAMIEVSLKVGSLGSLLREHAIDPQTVRPLVEDMLRTKTTPTGVCLNAAVWVVTGSVGAAPLGMNLT